MRRRLFLLLVNVLPGFAGVARLETAGATTDSVDRDVLDALVDTIVPADETPGALDIGLGEVMAQEIGAGTSLGRALMACITGADRLATEWHGAPFFRLEQAAREKLVLAMLGESGGFNEANGVKSPRLRAAARLVRDAVIRRYYLHPVGQESAGYTPPWPGGYRNDADG